MIFVYMNPWCDINTYGKNLRKIIEGHYNVRYTALKDLMSFNDARFNIDFFSKFEEYWQLKKDDIDCLCNHLVKEDNTTGTNFRMNRVAIGKGGVGSAYEMTVPVSGDRTGCIKYLVIKVLLSSVKECPYLSMRLTEVLLTDTMLHILRMNPSIEMNQQRDSRTRKLYNMSVYCDDFSNQTCMHMILDLVLRKYNGNRNYIYQYDAFICKKDGVNRAYTIMDKADGDLRKYFRTELNNSMSTGNIGESIWNILVGVMTPLAILKQSRYGFVHADCKLENVFWMKLNSGGVRFMIADYDKSSIYFNGVRFYNGTRDFAGKDLVIKYPTLHTMAGNEYYTLRSLRGYTGDLMRMLGINIPVWQLVIMYGAYGFYMSHDIYTFILSLASEPIFWEFIKEGMINGYVDFYAQRIVDIWKSLWFPDDLDRINSTMEAYHKSSDSKKQWNINEINDFLITYEIKLLYNVDHVYKMLGIELIDNDPFSIKDRKDILLSKNGKLCVTSCKSGMWGNYCDTNRYSSKGKLHDWDYCV